MAGFAGVMGGLGGGGGGRNTGNASFAFAKGGSGTVSFAQKGSGCSLAQGEWKYKPVPYRKPVAA